MLRYSAIQGSRCLLAALAAGVVGVVLADALAEFVDPAAELLQGLDHRLDPLGAQAEFLDQPDRAAAAASQPAPRRPALGRRARLAGGDVVVAPVPLQQRFQRVQIVRQPAENLVLLELVGHRDLHGAVEGQLAVVDPPQHLHRRLHHVVAFQDLVAEPRAGHLDLLGQGDFLLPGQQRNLAHLRQIHANRIVGPGFVLDAGQQVFGGQVQFGVVFFVVVQDRAVQVVFFNVQHLDGILRQVQRLVRPEKSVRLPSRPTVRRTKCCSSGKSRSTACKPAPVLHYPTNDGQSKKFYHRISAPRPPIAIWQRIQPAVRIRSRVARTPNVPESAKRLPLRVNPPFRYALDRPKPDSSTSTGHQVVRWPIPPLRFRLAGNRGIHLCARRHYDAHTVTLTPRPFIIIALFRSSSIFWTKMLKISRSTASPTLIGC